VGVEKLPSGKYRGVVRHNGKKATTTAVATRSEASMLEAQLKLRMGASPPTDSITVAELLRAQLDHGNYSPTSFADLQRIIERLPDTFATRAVRDVTPFVLDGLYQQLARDGWSPFRIRRVHEIVGASYRKRAIPFRWAISNPARDVRPPALPTAEIKPPGLEEVQRLLAAASGPLRVFLRLSANTGARRGEVLAIQWRDVDLDVGRIVIRRSIVHTPASGLVIRETKTGRKGHRVIGIGPSVVAELTAHRVEQAAQAAEQSLPAPWWVFSHDAGISPWRPDFVTLKFNRLRKAQGLEHVRLHDLRHFVATSMLSDGVPVATVSKRLGHARSSTTLDRYSHWMPAVDADAADRLDAQLS
jgi:integrase